MADIFVLGSLNNDLVIRAPRMPKAGETLHGSGFISNCGGKGANQAVAAARAGARVYMVGCVGADVFGNAQLDNLKASGVDTRFVRCVDNVPTGTAVIIIAEGDNRIVLDSGANACVCNKDVDAALKCAQKGDYLLVQYEIPQQTIAYAVKTAQQKDLVVIVNPAPAQRIDQVAKHADYFVPNESELALLSGVDDMDEGAKILLNQTPNLIVTMGDKGAAAYSGGKIIVPAYKVDAVDSTAAGDTFIGYLAANLVRGLPLVECMRVACAASAIAVSREGAQTSVPHKQEVAKFLNQIRQE